MEIVSHIGDEGLFMVSVLTLTKPLECSSLLLREDWNDVLQNIFLPR